ncbi:MAG: hypothetical protein ACLR2E_00445 [Lachnospiraceae bacterium]
MEKFGGMKGDLSAGAAGDKDHVCRFRFIFYKDKICNGIKKCIRKTPVIYCKHSEPDLDFAAL